MANARDRLKKHLEEQKVWQRYLAEHRLTETEASCLTYLGTREIVGVKMGISISEVFQGLVPPHSTSRVSTAMAGHYRDGLITKECNPSDQRSVLVSLTREGLAKYKQLEALFGESQGEQR